MAGDPRFNYVALLLPFDGTNGSTTFIDKSRNPKTVTAYGAAQISTAQSKFGGASMRGAGSLELPANSLYFSPSASNVVGCVDFTIEAWVYCNGSDHFVLYCLGSPGSGTGTIATNRSGLSISAFSGGAVNIAAGNLSTDSWAGYLHRVSTTTLPASGWAHIAVTCVSNVPHVFINGVESTLAFGNVNSTLTSFATTKCYSPRLPQIMSANAYQGAMDSTAGDSWTQSTGSIDDLRITKGLARYTVNFTPPTAANELFADSIGFDKVVLQLPMDGDNASTIFRDRSLNPKVITVGGNAKISTAQSKFSGASAAFDGTGDYLSVPYSADFDVGNGDFTLEMWVYKTANSTNGARLWNPDGDFFDGINLGISAAGSLESYGTTNGTSWNAWSSTAIAALSNAVWYHIALVRNKGEVAAYVNGTRYVLTSTLGSSALYTNTSVGRVIGGQGTGTNRSLNGYIDDFRFIKGVAKYTAAFVTPIAPFEIGDPAQTDALANDVVLLIHADEAHGATAISDYSNNTKTITAVGDAKVSRANSKFGPGSLAFDGTGDYLTVADHSDLDLGYAFTVEAWVSFAALPSSGNESAIVYRWDAGASKRSYYLVLANVAGVYKLRAGVSSDGTSGTAVSVSGDWTPALDTWYHVAVTHSGSNLTLWQSGSSLANLVTTTQTYSTDIPLSIGAWGSAAGGDLNGYVDGLRITRGYARYTTAFTTTTTPFADPSVFGDVYFGSVALLLPFDGDNASTVFQDRSPTSKAATVFGNAQISTAQSKFGGASALFDGAGDYISFADSADLDLATEDFTIEFWVRPAAAAFYRILSKRDANAGFLIYIDSSAGVVNWQQWDSSATLDDAPVLGNIAVEAWSHIAVCRLNGVVTTYLNGIGGVSLNTPRRIGATTAILSIGLDALTPASQPFNGYLDDLRITTGVARYSSNFTPAVAPCEIGLLPPPDTALNSVSLLLRGEGAHGSTSIIDASVNSKALTLVGGTKVSRAYSKLGAGAIALDGTGDYITVEDNADFAFGTGDFTIEGWMYWQGGSYAPMIQKGAAPTSGFYLEVSATNLTFGMLGDVMQPAVTTTQNSWMHLCITRSAGTYRLFKNGALVATSTAGPHNLTCAEVIKIGSNQDSSALLTGLLDELRVTKGLARYTAAFTPYSSAFRGSEGSAFLTVPLVVNVFENYSLTVPVTVNVAFSLSVPIVMDIVMLYSLMIPVKVMVGEVIELSLSVQVESSNWRLKAPLTVKNYQNLTLTIPLSISVANLGFRLRAPLTVRMHETLTLTIPLQVQVYPAFASGVGGQGVGQVLHLPANNAMSWSLKVLLKGEDVSPRLTGQVNIDADESSAAIATFMLSPGAGLIDPYAWVKAPVLIYHVTKDSNGSDVAQYLIFSGLVDTPNYDTTSRLTEFTCTDNLQNEVLMMSHSEVDALTPLAKYSKFVFDETANSWDYLQDRLSTYPYAVKLDLNRNLQAYDYRAGRPQYEMNANMVVEGSLAISLANARDITNQFEVTLDTQYELYRETVADIYWQDQDFGSDLISWSMCSAQMAIDAVGGSGATFVKDPLFLMQPPSQGMSRGVHYWIHLNPGTDLTLIGFRAAISKRFKQSITEKVTCTVTDTNSVAQLGVIGSELSASISVEHSPLVEQAFNTAATKTGWLCSAGSAYEAPRSTADHYYTDPSLFVGGGWVPYPKYSVDYKVWDGGAYLANMHQYKYKLDNQGNIRTEDWGFQSPGGANPGEYLYNFDSLRTKGTDSERAEVISVLLAQAKQNIVASHRQNRVTCSTLINPFLQRGQTLRVATPNLIATGIAHQLQHVYDISAGSAMTNITLALSASKALGIPGESYSNVRFTLPISIDMVDNTVRSSLPINQSDLNYNQIMFTDYSGSGLASYPFGSNSWGGYFTHKLQGTDHEFAIEFPTLPVENTENATITLQNAIIDADVPNDELYLL